MSPLLAPRASGHDRVHNDRPHVRVRSLCNFQQEACLAPLAGFGAGIDGSTKSFHILSSERMAVGCGFRRMTGQPGSTPQLLRYEGGCSKLPPGVCIQCTFQHQKKQLQRSLPFACSGQGSDGYRIPAGPEGMKCWSFWTSSVYSTSVTKPRLLLNLRSLNMPVGFEPLAGHGSLSHHKNKRPMMSGEQTNCRIECCREVWIQPFRNSVDTSSLANMSDTWELQHTCRRIEGVVRTLTARAASRQPQLYIRPVAKLLLPPGSLASQSDHEAAR